MARERSERVLRDERSRSTRDLRDAAEARRGDTRPFEARLRRPPDGRLRVIAEVKKASPSAGVLRSDFDPAGIAAAYEAAGAAAISVLTEPARFLGSMEHLASVRARVTLPVLAKDFVIHERQIYEARAHGADAILLIVALLSGPQLTDYAALSREVGLEPLLEAFDERDLERAWELPGVVGVNNRDLHTFATNLETSVRLADKLKRVLAVSESGLRCSEDLTRLESLGYRAFLIGEQLLTAEDPEKALQALLR